MFDSPAALQRAVDFLDGRQIPYMVIGGLAISVWGETRVTRDADPKVHINMPVAEFRTQVFEHFPERLLSVPERLKSQHVVQIWAMPEIAVDLLVSILEYEKQAMARAIATDVMGVPTRICTAEDLIVRKVLANLEKDWLDV